MTGSPSPFDRLLAALGIHARSYRALLRSLLLMDLRGQHYAQMTRTGPADLISPLVWIVGLFLLTGGTLAAVLFVRVDGYAFAFAALAVSMVVVATSVIVEFSEVVLDPNDLHTLGHLPVPVRTYSAARMTNLGIYVLIMSAALNLMPAIVGAALRETGWAFVPIYALTSLIANFAVAGIVILVFTVIVKTSPPDSVRTILSWTQTALILVFVYGGQLVFRDTSHRLEVAAYQLSVYDSPAWVKWLPPAWLATFVDSCMGDAGPFAGKWWILGVSATVTLIIWVLATWRLGAAYSSLQPGQSAWQRVVQRPLPQPGSVTGRFARVICRTKAQLAGYSLCSLMLRRDLELRIRIWPSLGLALAPLLLGWFSGQLQDPVTSAANHPDLKQAAFHSVLSLTALYLLAAPIPTVFHNIQFSKDHAASWVLAVAPISDRAGFAEGMRKAATIRLVWPVLVFVMAVFVLAGHPLVHVLLHGVVALLLVEMVGHISKVVLMRGLPFTLPPARGGTMGPGAAMAGAIGAGAMALAGVQFVLVRSTFALATYLVVLLLLCVMLRWWASRPFSRHAAASQASSEEPS